MWEHKIFEYSEVNVKLWDSQLNKLKSAVQNQASVALKMNIKTFIGNNLSLELLLTARWKTKLRNAFEKNRSTDIKLSITQISKIIQSVKCLASLLRTLAPLAKNILAPLRIIAAASPIDAGIQKNVHGSGATTLIISNEEMNDIMKNVQVLEDSNILLI